MTDVARPVTLAQFIEAFYTTAVFRLERLILGWAVSKPSNDADVKALVTGQADSFAAWDVEARTADQLLLCDYQGRTRSWLMVEPIVDAGFSTSRLYFGSAVVRRSNAIRGNERQRRHRVLLGFHKLYSQVLLAAARGGLGRQ